MAFPPPRIQDMDPNKRLTSTGAIVRDNMLFPASVAKKHGSLLKSMIIADKKQAALSCDEYGIPQKYPWVKRPVGKQPSLSSKVETIPTKDGSIKLRIIKVDGETSQKDYLAVFEFQDGDMYDLGARLFKDDRSFEIWKFTDDLKDKNGLWALTLDCASPPPTKDSGAFWAELTHRLEQMDLRQLIYVDLDLPGQKQDTRATSTSEPKKRTTKFVVKLPSQSQPMVFTGFLTDPEFLRHFKPIHRKMTQNSSVKTSFFIEE